jgi:hypothetical protein
MGFMVNPEQIQNYTKKIYGSVLDVKILQEELEDMLSSIDKNNIEYNNGKISKEIFEISNKKFREESLSLINKINELLEGNLSYIKTIVNNLTYKKKKEKIKRHNQKNKIRAIVSQLAHKKKRGKIKHGNPKNKHKRNRKHFKKHR